MAQVQTEDESLNYIPNLVSGFIKREFESALSSEKNTDLSKLDEKAAEKALKKTNELIENLAESHNIKLNIGVAFINNEKILLSKIGKVKMLLHRKNAEDAPETQKVFDVFENVTQFNKEHYAEKRFSSVISGDILDGDKIFFFIPNRRLSLRQNYIKTAIYKFNQDEFADSFYKTMEKARIKGSKDIFCCGIHLELKEESVDISPAKEQTEDEEIIADNNFLEDAMPEKTKPSLIASQILKISKENLIKLAANKAKKISYTKKLYIIIGIALITLAAVFIINSTYQGSKLTNKIKLINEKIKTAESKFLLKDNKEARGLLKEAINELKSLDNKKASSYIIAAEELLKKIDKINDLKPTLINNLSNLQNPANQKVVSLENNIYVVSSGVVYKINGNDIKKIAELKNPNLVKIKNGKIAAYGDESIQILDVANKEITELKKKFNFEPRDLGIYKDNLYFLGTNNIYKISNALEKPISELYWLKDKNVAAGFISFDLDSSIYILNKNNKLLTFYKGKLVESKKLEFPTSEKSKLILIKNAGDGMNGNTDDGKKEFLILNPEEKIIRRVNDNAELIESFDISPAGEIKDISYDPATSTIYIVSSSGLWKIKM